MSINSQQDAPHADLATIVARHAQTTYRKPIQAHNAHAFAQFLQHWQTCGAPPIILDSGCGVGESTLHLAQQNPHALVVGIDQSLIRINTRKTWWTAAQPTNLLWLRSDVQDFWRLLAQAQHHHPILLEKHYLLYPNPYPKIGQLGKRWHGHAIFPELLALSRLQQAPHLHSRLEVRSNWNIYIQEFAQAVTQLTGQTPHTLGAFTPNTAITPFERKYAQRGETLWRVVFGGVS